MTKKIPKRIDAFNDKSIKIPFVYPQISSKDKNAIMSALNSILLTDGPQLNNFEKKFSKFTKSKFAIGTSNATSSLELCLRAIGIKPGDEVLVPNLTFVATASAVLHCGATPILVDVDKNTLNINFESLKKSITKKTKAIIPVHFAGRYCDIHKIKKICRENQIKIIEDCAHAIGTRYKDQHVGTFGDAGCFSFYPTKNITTIEGGMIITNSKSIMNDVKKSRNHGIDKTLVNRFSNGNPWDFDIKKPGFNYRLDEIRSALGISQLNRIKSMNLQRKKINDYYSNKLKSIKGIITPLDSSKNENSYHLYIIRITKEFPKSRDQVFKELLKKGIRTSVHYKPLSYFSIFKNKAKIYDKVTNSVELYKEILSLPMFPELKKFEQDYIIDQIKIISENK